MQSLYSFIRSRPGEELGGINSTKLPTALNILVVPNIYGVSGEMGYLNRLYLVITFGFHFNIPIRFKLIILDI